MIRINLIPPGYIANINRRVIIAKIVLGAVLAFAVVTLLSLWQITRAGALKSTLAKRETELQSLQGDVQKVNAIEANIAEVQRYLDAINHITNGRFIYTKFLQETARDLPATIWFTSINTSLAGDMMGVTFAVQSRSAYDLADWLNALETKAGYSSVNLSGITIAKNDLGKIFSTQVTLKCATK
ncbi:MAG: hypothetical protein NTX59_01395 [Elusimicrobia bacterium]|nr:hypothetical protein [Elusimicrobiota bacterium]